jgi:hypothetical protein
MCLEGSEVGYIILQLKASQHKTRRMFHLLGQNQQKNKKKVNRCNPVKTRGKWTNVALEKAMEAIENGTT